MNLELIDPFGRQIPDRIDSTLQLPASLHFQQFDTSKQKKKPSAEDQEWKAVYHVSFNRRGTYLAVGHGSGTVAVFNILSRSLSSLYQCDDPEASPGNCGDGVTSVSWSRRSRTLLAGAAGDSRVRLFDTTHPHGPQESCKCLGEAAAGSNATSTAMSKSSGGADGDDDVDMDSPQTTKKTTPKPDAFLPGHPVEKTKDTSFLDNDLTYSISTRCRKLSASIVEMGQIPPPQTNLNLVDGDNEPDTEGAMKEAEKSSVKHPCVSFEFKQQVGGALQLNPRIPTGGLAALADGSLVLFWVHPSGFISGRAGEGEQQHTEPQAIVIPLCKEKEHWITCAAFDHHGERVYAATRDGVLLGFDVSDIWSSLEKTKAIPTVAPHFRIEIGGSAAWHLLVSRNGKYLVVNSSEGALRLFSTKECWEEPEKVDKPMNVFQDVVSKVKFACCDLSGDGEYVVGGANGDDNKYELYIWNTATGVLMDKLTGSSVQLYSIAWHPTRSFLAAATSDGIIDVWGPRINWTAFAPDFQALPMNVEYVEREDEFDVDTQGRYLMDIDNKDTQDDNENDFVDVATIERVPVFASDSEDEEEVFSYQTKVVNLLAERGRKNKISSADD